MTKERSIVILKNDAVGDLTQSLPAINNIIKNNKTIKIFIYSLLRWRNCYVQAESNWSQIGSLGKAWSPRYHPFK